jgi:predicted nucleotidyltransferase
MVKSTVIEALAFMRECLEEEGLRVAKIILFGSYAREKATEESDIDVAIVSDDFRNKDIFERAKLTQDPEILTIRKYMIPLDIITLTTEEYESGSSLISLYAQDGEVVYAA